MGEKRWVVRTLRAARHPWRSISAALGYAIGIPLSVWFVNVIFQNILRINSDVKFQVNFTSRVIRGDRITLGRNVWKSFALSGGCYIQGGNGIVIGDDTIFAPCVKIISANHDPENLSAWQSAPPIRIGQKCWIGAGAIILPGVELGDGCIVGAGSVVTRSFPAMVVVASNPARIIKEL